MGNVCFVEIGLKEKNLIKQRLLYQKLLKQYLSSLICQWKSLTTFHWTLTMYVLLLATARPLCVSLYVMFTIVSQSIKTTFAGSVLAAFFVGITVALVPGHKD